MITDETDPRMVAAAQELGRQIERISRLFPRWTPAMFHRMRQFVKEHRTRCRQEGLDFPPMTFMLIPRFERIALIREDLDLAGIRSQIIALARQLPGVTAPELYAAVRHAFPHLKSVAMDLADEGDAVQRAKAKHDAKTEAVIAQTLDIAEPAGSA